MCPCVLTVSKNRSEFLSIIDAVCSVARFAKADPAYGAGVAQRVGLTKEIPAE